MIRAEDFMRGELSVPSTDADDLPECCWRCPFLQYKEFSTSIGEGLFYYFCAYNMAEREASSPPGCFQDHWPKGTAGGL